MKLNWFEKINEEELIDLLKMVLSKIWLNMNKLNYSKEQNHQSKLKIRQR